VEHGNPSEVWNRLFQQYNISSIFANRDYEPYALKRDRAVAAAAAGNGVEYADFKDHVIFEKDEVAKDDGHPYSIYTPFMRKWMQRFQSGIAAKQDIRSTSCNFLEMPQLTIPTLESIGFRKSRIPVPETNTDPVFLNNYARQRNIPSVEGTSRIGMHLRFGTISIRRMVVMAAELEQTWLRELVWREFFIQILWHYPRVVETSFRKEYDRINWRNDAAEFRRWCEGTTGYPLVDAGMRELSATGFMHNRVRMATASFLCKHLLIDWRWGEAHFARHLLDYELASNNGNWQWAAGTGCDAAPYFRIFNPTEQQKKFDPQFTYIRKWLPEYGTNAYPGPITEHRFARERALATYKNALIQQG
jgi:deoxyribodipyrimidine photo-lyase